MATHMTGILISQTAFHSFQLSATTEKSPCRNGVYSKAKWRAIDKLMA